MLVTLNFELADRFIPSYCSVSIIKWDQGVIVSQLHYLINPETKIEKFLSDKHGIKEKDILDAYKLRDIWHNIYDILEDELVVIDGATSFIKGLKKRCIIDGLSLPNFRYVCMRSMFNQSYKKERDFKTTIPEIKEWLNIDTPNYNSYYDAIAIKNIVDFCLLETGNFQIKGLYEDANFVIGEVFNNEIYNKTEVKKRYKEGDFFE